jgi:hypothetical protein
MVETIYDGGERRYVVANKDKIIIITHTRKYANYIDELLKQKDYDVSYSIKVNTK